MICTIYILIIATLPEDVKDIIITCRNNISETIIHPKEVISMKRLLPLFLIVVSFTATAFQITYQNPFMEYPFHTTQADDGVVIIVINHCDPIQWEYGIPLGYRSLRELWDSMCSEDAHFTVRAGDEFLIYSQNTLSYSKGDQRYTIIVYPEELWAIMSHYHRPLSQATSEVSMQAWFPGMDEAETAFITIHDPAMSVIQVLLQRARENVQ